MNDFPANPPWEEIKIIANKLDQIHTDNEKLLASNTTLNSSLRDINTALLNSNDGQSPISSMPPANQDYGTAFGGDSTKLIDTTKGWAKNQWFQALLYVNIKGKTYCTSITGNNNNTLNFSELPENVIGGCPYRILNTSTKVTSGQTRPGVALNDNQQLLSFVLTLTDQVPTPYIIPWVQAPAAPGAVSHVYNADTGLVSPYTVASGYSLSIIEKRFWFNQDVDGWLYLDGMLVSTPVGIAAGQQIDDAEIAYYSTLQLDPTASSSHTLDLQIINRGLGNMMGGITVTVIMTAERTPPFPTQKDTKCPFCGTINNVHVTRTNIKCSNCGKMYVVYNTTAVRKI